MNNKPNGLVYEQTVLDINFELGSDIPSLGYIKFLFPEKLIFENNNERPDCYAITTEQAQDISFIDPDNQVDCNVFSYSVDPDTYGIRELKLTNMCFRNGDLNSTVCYKYKEYMIRVTNILNAQSIKLIEQDEIIHYNSYTPEDNQIDIGLITTSEVTGLQLTEETWE